MSAVITGEGQNLNLDNFLIGPWQQLYIGLIDAAGFVSLAISDSAAGINTSNGWDESTSYSETGRQPLIVAPATGGTSTNAASLAAFTMVGTGTIKGAFIISDNTKGGTVGRIFNEFSFSGGNVAFTDGQVISVTSPFTCAPCS